MATVTLNESGYSYQVNADEFLAELAKHGDDPREYSTNLDDFVFVSVEYAQEDPNWDVPENWPEDLPVWEYRPA